MSRERRQANMRIRARPNRSYFYATNQIRKEKQNDERNYIITR
jgi:hypothetical protein|nr:MAG TPA: hypothetical protein [Caudoviricetes sp.]